MYAGAKSLTCSLWETENKVGNRIITDYIKNLEKGQQKDLALQASKLQFIQSADPLLQHPFYWSTFVNVGNQDSISIVKSNHSFLNLTDLIVFTISMFIMGILFLIIRKSKIQGNVSVPDGIK